MSLMLRSPVVLFAFAILLVPATHLQAQRAPWPDPIAEEVIPALSLGLTEGPMLGLPGASSVRVWIRSAEPVEFQVRYATQLPLTEDCPSVTGQTDGAADNTGWVDLTDLEPFTRYYYGVVLDGQLADTRVELADPWPSFRTLPDGTSAADAENNPQGLFNVTFSVTVCASQDPVRSGSQYTDPPGWQTLHRQFGDEVMFNIMNGDYIYEEQRDETLESIYGNYRLYLDRSRGLSRFARCTPWLQMHDDHEVNDNLFGAGEVGFQKKNSRHVNRDHQLKAWEAYAGWANPYPPQRGPMLFGTAQVRAGSDTIESADVDFSGLDPARVSTILVGEVDRPLDKGGSGPNAGTYGLVEVLDAHRIRVTPAFAADETIDFTVGTHHYYDYRVGNCHFFVLDTRGERSHFNGTDLYDPATFLLGETQRTWLLDGVRRTDADFIFIVSSVGVVVPHSAFHVRPEAGDRSKGDGFPGFVHERELILDELDRIDKPIMFFTGDVHSSVSAQITDNVWEFMVSPMASNGHPIGTLGNMPFCGWYNAEGRWVRIKWVGSAPNNIHYSRLHRAFFAVVRVNNVFACPKPDGEGAGYQFLPYEYPQVTVTWYSSYTGKPVYSEAVSPLDLVPPPAAAAAR